jgi:hypothetical protein
LKVILTVVVLAVGGLIAGCGSSSSSSKSTTSATASAAAGGAGAAGAAGAAGGAPNAARRAALAACLKQHGVTLPARPPGAGGGQPPGSGTGTTPRGGFFGGGGGRFANNPKLRAAFQACGGRLGFGGGQRFRLSRALITKYVTCVRQHGYNLPSPNLSGKGPVFPSNIRGNTKFQAASRACQNLLVPPRRGTTTTSGA